MAENDANLADYLELAVEGRPQALGHLLEVYRPRLLRIAGFRMDARLRGRLDPEDIVQEGYFEATKRFGEYAQKRNMPFFLWLRFIVMQKLQELHRRHLLAQARDAGREVSIFAALAPQATSKVLAANLIGKLTSPSVAAVRAEMARRVEDILNTMSETDREILALRHFEKLKNEEVANLLEISQKAASSRFIRALKRLQIEALGSESDDQ